MRCEMCHAEGELSKVEIEGTILKTCSNCSKLGKILGKVKESLRDIPSPKNQARKSESMELLVEDYSKKIRAKRENLGLTQKEFANKLSEKESLIHKMESGHFEPSFQLAKKLQKFLKIRLIEEYEEKHEKSKGLKSEGFTIGDFIKKK